jgi:hypothetical protein
MAQAVLKFMWNLSRMLDLIQLVNSRLHYFRISCKTYSSVSLEGGLGYFVFEGSYSLLVL